MITAPWQNSLLAKEWRMSYFSAKDILWVLEAKVIDFMVSFFREKVVEVLGCAFEQIVPFLA